MREYLERIFPVIANDKNETTEERTWHLYDMLNFLEFFVFFMLRTVLDTFFTICFVIVKFGMILLFTYAFAFCIFFFLDRYMPEDNNRTSASKLKRPSEFKAWKENSGKTLTRAVSDHTKLDRNDSQIESLREENNGNSLPFVVSYTSKSSENDNNKLTLIPTKSEIFTGVMDLESHFSGESVVRVGSFKRPSAENGQHSVIGRALEDLANIETKTYSRESEHASVSLTSKGATEETKSSNA